MKIRNAVIRTGKIIKTPLVMGLFKPIVIIPDTFFMTAEEKTFAITHELTHIKNRDLWVKFFANIVSVIHWFNPLAHLLCKKINDVSEAYCDECMAMSMTVTERRAYGNLILKTATAISISQTKVYSTLSAKSRKIERRLLNMANLKKPKKIAVIVSVIAAVAICGSGAVYAFAAGNDSAVTGKTIDTDKIVYAMPIDEIPKGYSNIKDAAQNSEKLVSDTKIISDFETNSESIYQVVSKNGKISDITFFNGQVMLISKSENAGWKLSKGEKLTISLDIDLSDKNSAPDGEWTSIGYYDGSNFVELNYSKINDTTLDFAAPANGEYYFYLMNLSAGAQNYKEIKIY